jgi:hypothetical protein
MAEERERGEVISGRLGKRVRGRRGRRGRRMWGVSSVRRIEELKVTGGLDGEVLPKIPENFVEIPCFEIKPVVRASDR